jgi:hypothetical protein
MDIGPPRRESRRLRATGKGSPTVRLSAVFIGAVLVSITDYGFLRVDAVIVYPHVWLLSLLAARGARFHHPLADGRDCRVSRPRIDDSWIT